MVETDRGARCDRCQNDYPERDGVLHLVLGRRGDAGFDPHFFPLLYEVEDRHFWFVGRRRVVLEALQRAVPDLDRRRIFDIGCGTGGLLSFLGQSGIPLAGACDAYVESLAIVRKRCAAPLILVDEGRPVPLGEGHSLVAMFDVLEHIDDDRETLVSVRRSLEPGGSLVVTVPAHPALFDEMDEIACHRRRYTRSELRAKLEEAGFEVRILTHFMSPLVPLLMATRWVGRFVSRSRNPQEARARRRVEFRIVPGLNSLLGAILALERILLRFTSLPFGSSLLAVASRPAIDA